LLHEILEGMAGINFDHDASGQPIWGYEAAHSRRRILHVSDGTGQAIITGLIAALRRCQILRSSPMPPPSTSSHFRIMLADPLAAYSRSGVTALTCLTSRAYRASLSVSRDCFGFRRFGPYFFATPPIHLARARRHRHGASRRSAHHQCGIHPVSSDRSGCTRREGFLISEAVRGEGGILLSPDGRAFMADYSPEWKDLAPRDVVAHAIHHQMETHGYSHVLLDIASHMSPMPSAHDFPTFAPHVCESGSILLESRFRSCPQRITFVAAYGWTNGDDRASKIYTPSAK